MTSSTTVLAALLKRATLDDHEEVLHAADAALAKKTTPGGGDDDIGALHAKVVALLKLDRYEDALRTLEGQDGHEAGGSRGGGERGAGGAKGGRGGKGGGGGDSSSRREELRKRTPVERAYALYKVGRWDEARALAQQQQQQEQEQQEQQQAFSGARDQRALKHIEAQANYRLENFADAAKLYRQLAAEPSDVENEDVDIRINRSAVEAQQLWRARSQGGGSIGDGLVEGCGGRTKPTREDLEAFETTYNAACCSVAAGEYARADFLLKRAAELCDALDDLSEEEKRAESLPIIAQHVYVLLKLNKRAEAQALSDKIAIDDTSDQTTRRIAQNNKLALSFGPASASAGAANPYHAQRLFHAHSAGANPKNKKKNDALYSFQASSLQRNAYVLDMATFKHSGVATSTAAYLARQRHPSLSPHVNAVSVVNAAAHARGQAGRAGLKETLALLDKRPTDVGLLLTAVQLYASMNNYDAAASLTSAFVKRLEGREEKKKEKEKEGDLPSSGGDDSSSSNDDSRNKDARYAPGLVALYVTLLRKQGGRHEQVREELKKAALHWRARQQQQQQQQEQRDADSYQRYRPLFRAAAVELLKSRKRADAALAGELFAALRQRDAADRVAVAGHIAATARTDLRQASALMQAQAQPLTPAARLVTGINAEELEMAGVPTKRSIAPASPSSFTPAAAAAASGGGVGGGNVTQRAGKKRKAASSVAASKKQQQPARKRIKKSRLPKDYDPAKPPDPERWLPLRQRSYYKPKVRKGKGRLTSTRTQGGFVPESQEKSAPEQAGGGGGGSADASKAEKKKKAPAATSSGANKKGKGGKR